MMGNQTLRIFKVERRGVPEMLRMLFENYQTPKALTLQNSENLITLSLFPMVPKSTAYDSFHLFVIPLYIL